MTRFKLHLSTEHRQMKFGPVNINTIRMYGPNNSEVSNCLPAAYRLPFEAAIRKGWNETRQSDDPARKPTFYVNLLSAKGKYLNTVYAFEMVQP